VEAWEDGVAKVFLVVQVEVEEVNRHLLEEQAPLDRVTMVEILTRAIEVAVAVVLVQSVKAVLQVLQVEQDWLLLLLELT
jgi:DNA phosphorothioation-dependent restriction protein DptG